MYEGGGAGGAGLGRGRTAVPNIYRGRGGKRGRGGGVEGGGRTSERGGCM